MTTELPERQHSPAASLRFVPASQTEEPDEPTSVIAPSPSSNPFSATLPSVAPESSPLSPSVSSPATRHERLDSTIFGEAMLDVVHPHIDRNNSDSPSVARKRPHPESESESESSVAHAHKRGKETPFPQPSPSHSYRSNSDAADKFPEPNLPTQTPLNRPNTHPNGDALTPATARAAPVQPRPSRELGPRVRNQDAARAQELKYSISGLKGSLDRLQQSLMSDTTAAQCEETRNELVNLLQRHIDRFSPHQYTLPGVQTEPSSSTPLPFPVPHTPRTAAPSIQAITPAPSVPCGVPPTSAPHVRSPLSSRHQPAVSRSAGSSGTGPSHVR